MSVPFIIINKNSKETQNLINKIIIKHKILKHNIFLIKPENNQIKINQLREISKFSYQKTGEKKLIVIENFDSAKVEAQNSFLKTLEECDSETQYVLIINNNIFSLVPTILSRCQILRSKSTFLLKTNLIEDKIFKDNIANLLYRYEFSSKVKAIEFIDQLINLFLKVKKNTLLTEIIKIRYLILNNHINITASIDHLLIMIKHNSSLNNFKNL